MAKDQSQTDTEVIDDDSEDALADKSQTVEQDAKVDDENEEAVAASDEFDKLMDETDKEEQQEEEEKKEQTGEEKKDTADKSSEEKKDTAEGKGEDKGDDKEGDKTADGKKSDEETDDSVLSDELLTKAVKFGFSLQEARAFKSAKALSSSLGLVERALTVASESKSGDDKKDTGDKKTEDAPGFKPFEAKPFELKFENEDEIDPELLTAIRGMNEHHKSQIDAMNAHNAEQFKSITDSVKSVTANMASQSNQNFEKTFDSMVSGLGKNFETELGKGGFTSLAKDSTQLVNRQKVVNAMDAIDAVRVQSKQSQLAEQEVFNQAVAIVFADKANKIKTEKIATKLTARSKQAISRPGGQKGKESSDDKALQTSKEFDDLIDEEE